MFYEVEHLFLNNVSDFQMSTEAFNWEYHTLLDEQWILIFNPH